jgi:2-methylcitrate dehydratase PrpD
MAWLDDPSEHSRAYGIGVAARNGVTAGLLAERGFGGPEGIFDAMKYNIFDAYAGEMHPAELTRDLGRDFYIEQADGFKQYPCCGDIHSGLDALLAILAEEGIESRQIAAITHYVRPERHAVIDNNPLRSHNAQYIMAVAAVNRAIRWDDFLEDRRAQPEIQALFGKVRLEKLAELDRSPGAAPAIVEVTTINGQRYRRRVDFAKGRSQNPFSPAELEQKFIRLATTVVDEQQARQMIHVINRLEELSDAGELVALMHSA